jgi:hypothetical protein
MKTSTAESGVLASCLALLKFRGIPAWRNNTGCAKADYGGKSRLIRFGKVGSSDIVGILPATGRWLAVETKRPASPGKRAGALTENQRGFLEMIREAGGVAVCVSDLVDLAEVISTLEVFPHARFDLDGKVISAPPTEEQR